MGRPRLGELADGPTRGGPWRRSVRWRFHPWFSRCACDNQGSTRSDTESGIEVDIEDRSLRRRYQRTQQQGLSPEIRLALAVRSSLGMRRKRARQSRLHRDARKSVVVPQLGTVYRFTPADIPGARPCSGRAVAICLHRGEDATAADWAVFHVRGSCERLEAVPLLNVHK